MSAASHPWEFQARFRRRAFGWRSQPAITRVRQAVAEIKKVARSDAVLAAEGAVTLLERLSPALEQVDSSSGSIGTAVNRAIAELVPIIASAPVDVQTRDAWLERLFEAQQADEIPYIEQLAEHWGELCASEQLASAWADRLVGVTRMALSPDKRIRGHFHSTSACLSALYRARRFDELLDILNAEPFWPYKRWAALALAAQGKPAEALRCAEASRGPWSSDREIDATCEAILLSTGMTEEAYARYGVRANQRGTYVASFRAVAEEYPHKSAGEVLADLVKATPGEEGKWFAAAKDAGLFDEALALASRTHCDPKTLTRAARDYVEEQPAFALAVGLLALDGFVQGYGYDVTSADVWAAYRATLSAAERLGSAAEVKQRIRDRVVSEPAGERFVHRTLRRELGL